MYHGENPDKLTNEYKYTIGAYSGNLQYFVTVDANGTTAIKTYNASQLTNSTKTTISYTNPGEDETVSGYIICYGEQGEDEEENTVARITGVTVRVNGVD